jgi:hypothetical protein
MVGKRPPDRSLDWNPYCEWLAIPPSHSPLIPEKLLGLGSGPFDLDRIERAGQRQLRRIEPHLHGPDGALASRLLQEVTGAVELLTKQALERETTATDQEAPVEPTLEEEVVSVGSEELVFEEPTDWSNGPELALPKARSETSGVVRVLFTASMLTLAILSAIAVVVIWRSRIDASAEPMVKDLPREMKATKSETAPVALPVRDEGCWRFVRGWDDAVANEWSLEGERSKGVRRIDRSASSADESFPSMAADGLSLLFARMTADGYEIHRLSRPTMTSDFDKEWVCTWDVSKSSPSAIWLGTDRLALARRVARGVEFSLAVALLDGRKYRWESLGPTVRGTEGDFTMDSKGRVMLFSRKIEGEYRIFECRRGDLRERFGAAILAPVSAGYRHPSISSDQRLMLMEGLASDGRVAIFASRRPSVTSAWSQPACLTSIRSADGTRGDFTPRLTFDEKHLLFASDRQGAPGRLDLYRVRVSEAIADDQE